MEHISKYGMGNFWGSRNVNTKQNSSCTDQRMTNVSEQAVTAVATLYEWL